MGGSLIALGIGAVTVIVTLRWLRPDPRETDPNQQEIQPLNYVIILTIGWLFLILGLAGIVYVLVT